MHSAINFFSHTISFNLQQEELKAYKEEHGDCNVPQRYKSNKELGSWVHRQRTAYNKEELCQARMDLLEKIGFERAPRRGMKWKK